MDKLKIFYLLISTNFSFIFGNNHNYEFGFINDKVELFVIDRDGPFEMSCSYYTNSAKDYKVKWLKSLEEISEDLLHISNYVEQVNCTDGLINSSVLCFNHILSFKHVCPTDLGIYQCMIVHDYIDSIDISNMNVITKQVVYKPIKIEIIFNHLDKPCLNSNIRLRCNVTPRVFDVQLFMRRNNQFIGRKMKKFISCKNKTVTMFDNSPIEYKISNATINDSGIYYCQALYDYQYSKMINLTFQQCSNKSDGYLQFNTLIVGLMIGLFLPLFALVLFCIKKRVGSKITPRYGKALSVDSQNYSFPTDLITQSTFNLSKQMKLGTLKLIKILGSGEFGEVYLGKATSFNDKNKYTLVAVKLLKHNAPSGNFIMEKDIMANLGDHDNIIKYIGFINLPDKIAIVMEYAKNGSLLNLLKAFQLSPSNTNERILCQFGIDVASGMEYLSSMNLIHRDLAARNVFVSEFWVLKIGDFGLTREACNYYRQINEGKVPIRWLALESLLYKKYSTMSDIWSFGILLWEIFSLGQTPYHEVTDISLLTDLIVHGKRNLQPVFCRLAIYNIMQKTWHTIASERPTFTDIILELKDIYSDCSCNLVRYE